MPETVMHENPREIVIYFTNGRMLRAPADKVKFCRLGQATDETYAPDIADGNAVVNWDNVCYVRHWFEPEEIDP